MRIIDRKYNISRGSIYQQTKMPKRRNPFGDCSPLQFKTHVGQRELSEGVDGKSSLKGIYGNVTTVEQKGKKLW